MPTDTEMRCPVCGRGVLADIAYDEGTPDADRPRQGSESREVVTFTCGHEVGSASLADARRDDPNVERRQSEETAQPIPTEGDAP